MCGLSLSASDRSQIAGAMKLDATWSFVKREVTFLADPTLVLARGPSPTDLPAERAARASMQLCDELPRGVPCLRPRSWRDARRTSSTVPKPAFVLARVRGASAVVVTPSVREGSAEHQS